MLTIPLSKGLHTIVDDDDYENLNQHKWCIEKGYAMRRATWKGKGIYMHRIIMQAPDGLFVDHINGDTLDNRKINLRLATNAQNLRNRPKSRGQYSSKYKGVHYFRRDGTWQAKIMFNYKQIHLGYFDTEIKAALAYDEAARLYHGEFARTNF